MGKRPLIQHWLCKCLANGVVGELVGVMLDPFESESLNILQVVMRVMLAAVTFDLADLLTHPRAKQRLFVDEGDADQIAAFSSQTPRHITQETQVRVQGRHAYFQRRTVAPRAVVIASHATEADSVQLLPRNTLMFEQR